MSEETVEMLASDANDLDDVVRVLGIDSSETTPAEAVHALHAEIERLRAELAAARAEIELFWSMK